MKQAAEKFLSAWGMQSFASGKSIKCYYAKSTKNKKRELGKDLTKPTRESAPSLKDLHCCPFNIPFNFIKADNSVDKNKGTTMHYKVKITGNSQNLNHSHELSPLYHRQALAKSGKLSLDLSKVKTILHSIRHNVHMPSLELRPYLEEVMPGYKTISGQDCCNFRQKVQLYLLKNPTSLELTMDSAQSFFSTKSSANEYINLDDHIVKVNIKQHFNDVLNNNNGSIHSINLLEKLSADINGFDYRVKYDDENIPEGFVWMTPNMRQNLIRFQDNIYLDAQVRKFNTSGYPYISPIITNKEGLIGQICESLIPEETLSEYTWVFIQWF